MSFLNLEQLPFVGMSYEFVGEKQGAPFSAYIVSAKPGQGPPLHTHPYVEVAFTLEGAATITVGDDTRERTRLLPNEGVGPSTSGWPDNERSVHVFGRHHRIEIVAKETSPQTVHLADGSVVEVDLPHFEPVAVERADNAAFASPIGDLTVRVLETLATT